jgi:hypothetical protein
VKYLRRSKVKTIAVRGKFDFSVFNLFFPVSDVEIERFLVLQAPLLKKHKAAVRLNFSINS